VETVKTVETVETVEKVETLETVETQKTEDLKKICVTHFNTLIPTTCEAHGHGITLPRLTFCSPRTRFIIAPANLRFYKIFKNVCIYIVMSFRKRFFFVKHMTSLSLA